MENRKILDFKPIFLNNMVAYSREEKDGYYSFRFISTAVSNEMILNHTCVEVMNLCNGNNSIEDITKNIANEYRVKTSIVLNDVINMIKEFSAIQMITWNGENPFINNVTIDLSKDYILRRLDYRDANRINKYIKECTDEKKYINPCVDKYNLYNAETLKSGFLTDAQFIFVLEKDQDIKGIFWGMNNINLSVNTIIAVSVDEDISLKVKNEFLQGCLSIIPQLSKEEIIKFRAYIKEDIDISKLIIDNLSFKKGFILEDELGFGKNVIEYDYAI